MLTIKDIRTRKEGQTFDCKSIQVAPKALAVPIVAMANADGGVLAVGVTDRKREIEGVDRSPEKLNEILRVPFDFCMPSVAVKFEYLPCVNKDGEKDRLLLIHVPASQTLHTNQADEAFMRCGDKSRKLSFDERIQLMYDKGERYYENTAVYGAQVSDIDMTAVAKFVKRIGYGKKPLDYLKENNDFVRKNPKTGDDEVSTACILLFGKNPQRFFPRARTRFIRYVGTEEKTGAEMNVIKDVTFEGTILNQVQKRLSLSRRRWRSIRFWATRASLLHAATILRLPFRRWWSMPVAIAPTTSKALRFRLKCLTTALCLSPPAICPDLSVRGTSVIRIFPAIPSLPPS